MKSILVIPVNTIAGSLMAEVQRWLLPKARSYSLERFSSQVEGLVEDLLEQVVVNDPVWVVGVEDQCLNLTAAQTLGAKVVFLLDTKGLWNRVVLRNLLVIWRRYGVHLSGIVTIGTCEIGTDLTELLFWGGELTGKGMRALWGKLPDFTDLEDEVTPAIFRQQLLNRAQHEVRRIILPEGEELRVLKAACFCAKRKIARCILLGDRERITRMLAEQGSELNGYLSIMSPAEEYLKYVDLLYLLRKGKGLTLEQAEQNLKRDVNLLATLMLKSKVGDGVVSGVVHTTAETVRPALQIIKTQPNVRLVSSVFFICSLDRILVFGDCAINPRPSVEDLVEITYQSVLTAAQFGFEPKVAMLSYATRTSATGPEVERVASAVRVLRETYPNLRIEGPLQYDAAIDPEVARLKFPGSLVAGQANVCIFPDLASGNIGYKIAQRSGNFVSVGPILQGLNQPINDLSRGSSVEDIIYTIAATAIQAT